MLTAAAVQRMCGLPEPVGLGTERQHMYMASFLPPLQSLSSALASTLPFTSFRQCSSEIKGHWGSQYSQTATNRVSLMPQLFLLTDTNTRYSSTGKILWDSAAFVVTLQGLVTHTATFCCLTCSLTNTTCKTQPFYYKSKKCGSPSSSLQKR